MRALTLLPLAVGLLVACPPSPPPVVPPDASDAAPVATDAAPPPPAPSADAAPAPLDACGKAQATLLRLQCKDARGRLLGGPNEHGASFAAVCRDDATKGVDVHPACLAAATTCAGVSSCSL